MGLTGWRRTGPVALAGCAPRRTRHLGDPVARPSRRTRWPRTTPATSHPMVGAERRRPGFSIALATPRRSAREGTPARTKPWICAPSQFFADAHNNVAEQPMMRLHVTRPGLVEEVHQGSHRCVLLDAGHRRAPRIKSGTRSVGLATRAAVVLEVLLGFASIERLLNPALQLADGRGVHPVLGIRITPLHIVVRDAGL
jgi:hypothetical protein